MEGLGKTSAAALPGVFCTHARGCTRALRQREVQANSAPRHSAGFPRSCALPGATLRLRPISAARGDEDRLRRVLAMAFTKPHTSISCCLELPQPFLAPSEPLMVPDGTIRLPRSAAVNICRNATRALQRRSVTAPALPCAAQPPSFLRGAVTPRGLAASSGLQQLPHRGLHSTARKIKRWMMWLVHGWSGTEPSPSATDGAHGHGHFLGCSCFGVACKRVLGIWECLL